MKIFKYLLAGVGALCGLFLIGMMLVVGAAGVVVADAVGDAQKAYKTVASQVPKMTVADLEKGQPFRDADRKDFIRVCSQAFGSDSSGTCSCYADQAGKELSHYERQTLLSIWSGDLMRIVAVAASASDIPQDKLEALNNDDIQVRMSAWSQGVQNTCMAVK